jgi:DNA polymerase
MNSDLLRQYLGYYQDLGIKTVYRRTAGATPPLPDGRGSVTEETAISEDRGSEKAPKSTAPFGRGSVTEAPAQAETLESIREDIGDCKRCRLHERRTNIVFGVGDPEAKLVFVGEGPGADEDAQGIPFVGRAGQLLTQMIENTAKREGIPLLRKDVYICNVVKCRPPDNRTPEPDEMQTCGQFLFRQLGAIRPKAICVLGATAAKAVLGRKEGVTRMRGNWYDWRGMPVMVTYHPSYLLRAYNQEAKREAWEDLKKVLHYVYD